MATEIQLLTDRINPVSVFALLIANVCSTASAVLSVVLAAFFLDDKQYADWIALSTVAFVVAPMGISAQVSAVRRTIVHHFEFGDHLRQIWVTLIWTTLLIVPVGTVFSRLFDLPLIGTCATLLVLPSGILQGTLFGWLQGQSKFFTLMWIAIIVGVLRPVAVCVAFAGRRNPVNTGSILQIAVSAAVILVVCVFVQLQHGSAGEELFQGRVPTFTNQLPAILLMTVLISTDVLISRLFLAENQLAPYATGTLLSKAIGVAPMAVTSVVLPRMFEANQNFNNRLKQYAGFLALSTVLINLGFIAIGQMGLSTLFDLSSSATIQFSLLGVAFAVLAHVGYEGIAKSPALTSAVLLFTVSSLAGGLFVIQPSSVLGVVVPYLVATFVGVTLLTVGIKRSFKKVVL